MKVITNSKQVIPRDAKKSYYAADLFLNKVLDGMLVEAAYRKLDLEDVTTDHNLDVIEGKFKT